MVLLIIKNSARGPLSYSFFLKEGGGLFLISRVGRDPGKFTSGTGRVSDPGSSKKAGKKTSIDLTLL